MLESRNNVMSKMLNNYDVKELTYASNKIRSQQILKNKYQIYV